METPELNQAMRHEMAKELWRSFGPMASRIVVTFDANAIQVIAFPPREEKYAVPSGPHSVMVRDNYVEET